MRTECCECDRVAASFWGDHAYCREHLPAAQAAQGPHGNCELCRKWLPGVAQCGCGMDLCEAHRAAHAHGLASDRWDAISEERCQQLANMPYAEYLNTFEWKRRVSIVTREDGGRCRTCQETEGLSVHHASYRRRGREARLDLVSLCRKCHARIHDKDAEAE